MVSVDAILLGLVVFGALVAVPLGIATLLVLLWGTRPGRGKRAN